LEVYSACSANRSAQLSRIDGRIPDEPDEQTTFTVWISKYALTKGVFAITAEDCFDTSGKMVRDMNNNYLYYHGKDWHKTRKAAVKRAKEMKAKKIASLKKSIERIRKLEF